MAYQAMGIKNIHCRQTENLQSIITLKRAMKENQSNGMLLVKKMVKRLHCRQHYSTKEKETMVSCLLISLISSG